MIKPQKPSARLGWIAPNGDWYPCAYTAHRHLASIIGQNLFPDTYFHDELLLEQNGWVSVRSGGMISNGKMITPDQMNTLRLIVEEFEYMESENPNISWDEELCRNPELYFRVRCFTMPTEGMKDSFAKTLRSRFDYLSGNDHSLVEESRLSRRNNVHPGD